MYRCHPQSELIRDLVSCQAIGEVRLVQASFSFRGAGDLNGRLLSPALGGGGILDVGCYCVSMARMIAGAVNGAAFADPAEVNGSGMIGAESGVDEYAVASLRFETASLRNSRRAFGWTWRIALVSGELRDTFKSPVPGLLGPIRARPRFMCSGPEKGREKMVIHSARSVYALEVDHVADHLTAGQSPAMSWEDSLGNMRTLDRWRDAIGLGSRSASHRRLMAPVL